MSSGAARSQESAPLVGDNEAAHADDDPVSDDNSSNMKGRRATREGWLWKRMPYSTDTDKEKQVYRTMGSIGARVRGVFAKNPLYKKRWFALKGDFLTYYRNPDEYQHGRSLGAIDLTKVADVRSINAKDAPGPTLELDTGIRKYRLSVDATSENSLHDLNDWISIIKWVSGNAMIKNQSMRNEGERTGQARAPVSGGRMKRRESLTTTLRHSQEETIRRLTNPLAKHSSRGHSSAQTSAPRTTSTAKNTTAEVQEESSTTQDSSTEEQNLKTKLQEAETELQSLKTRLKEKEERLSETQERIRELEEELKGYREKFQEKLQEENAELIKEKDDVARMKDDIEKEKEQLWLQNKELTKERDMLKQKLYESAPGATNENPQQPNQQTAGGARPQTPQSAPRPQSGPRPSPRPGGGNGPPRPTPARAPRPEAGAPRPQPQPGSGPRPARAPSAPTENDPGPAGTPRPQGGSGPRPAPRPGSGPRPSGGPTPGGAPRPQSGGPRPAAARPAAPRPGGQGAGLPTPSVQKKEPKRAPKKPVKPYASLRPWFWNKIPDAKIDNTVWEKLTDEDVELDTVPLLNKFAKTEKSGAKSTPESAAAEKEKKQAAAKKKPKKISLLDGKRQQNGGIQLAKLHLNAEQTRNALISMDDDVLTTDRVRLLCNLMPTQEEKAMLDDYCQTKEDEEELTNLDRFLYTLGSIPKAQKRLDCLQTERDFQARIPEMGNQIGTFTAASMSVAVSPAVREMLRRALALGNYVNGDSARGAAYGFKVESLLKMGNVRSTDGSMNLLDYFAKYLLSMKVKDEDKIAPNVEEYTLEDESSDEEGESTKSFTLPETPDVPLVKTEPTGTLAKAAASGELTTLLGACIRDLTGCADASSLSFSQLKSDFNQLRKSFETVSKIVDDAVNSGKEELGSQELIDRMSPFVEDADEVVQSLEEELRKLEWKFKGIAKAYGEDPTKIGMEEFFETFSKFGNELKEAAEKLSRELSN